MSMSKKRRNSGIILVLTGQSGVGKNTLINFLVRKAGYLQYPAYTTRPRRIEAGEVDGVDYRFVTDREFDRLVANHEMHDVLTFNGFRYASPISDFRQHLSDGTKLVLHLAAESALALKRKLGEGVCVVHISAPSLEDRAERLSRRGTGAAELLQRMGEDQTKAEFARLCDLLVVNKTDQAESVADQVSAFVEAHYQNRLKSGRPRKKLAATVEAWT